jgi:hypothetical protein
MKTMQEVHEKGLHRRPRSSCPMCRSEHGDNLARLQKEYDARMARLLDKNGLSKAWGRA